MFPNNYVDDWLRKQGYGEGGGPETATPVIDESLQRMGYGEKPSPVQSFDVPNFPKPDAATEQPFGGHYVGDSELQALNARANEPAQDTNVIGQNVTTQPIPPTQAPPPQTSPDFIGPVNAPQATDPNAIAQPTQNGLPELQTNANGEPLLQYGNQMLTEKEIRDLVLRNFLSGAGYGATFRMFGVDTPEKMLQVPGMGGVMKALIDTLKPTQTGHLGDLPKILSGNWDAAVQENIKDPNAVSRVLKAESRLFDTTLQTIGAVTGEVRDLPVIGPAYRALVEVPANIFNEAGTQTAGMRLLVGNTIGLPISDLLSRDDEIGLAARNTFRTTVPGLAIPLSMMFGDKMGFEDPNRYSKYLAELDTEARNVAMGAEPDATSYIGAAFNRADPAMQLFLGFTDPLNMIDIYPFHKIGQARAAARATKDLAGVPRVWRMLYGLPEQVIDEAGNPTVIAAEKLGIKKASTWEKLMPTNLTKNSRAYDMLNRSLDRVNSILPDLNVEQMGQFFTDVVAAAKRGTLEKEWLQKFPGMNSTDANLAIQLTADFDAPTAITRAGERRAAAKAILDGAEGAKDKVGSAIWDNAISSLRENKSLDVEKVFDLAQKYDLQYQWGEHISKVLRDKLGVTNPGVFKKMANTLRAWEGAMFIAMNPGSWVRNGMSNTGAMYVHGFVPWDNVDKIEASYKAIGWNPLGEMFGLDVLNAGRETINGGKMARGTFGAPLPQQLGRFITVNEQIENASRKVIMYRAMDNWLKQNHRRGRAFRHMPVDLENALREIHPRYPELIYGAIEQNIDAASISAAVENSLTHYKIQSFFDLPEFQTDLAAALGADGNITSDHVRSWMALHTDRLNEAITRARDAAERSNGTLTFAQALSDEFDNVLSEATEHAEKLRVRDEEMRQAMEEAAARKQAKSQGGPQPPTPPQFGGPQQPPQGPQGPTAPPNPNNGPQQPPQGPQDPAAPGGNTAPTIDPIRYSDLRSKTEELLNTEDKVSVGMMQRRLKMSRAEADAVLQDLVAQGVIEKDPKTNAWVRAKPKPVAVNTPQEIDAWIDEFTPLGQGKAPTPDAVQFYDNNADAIETRIKERTNPAQVQADALNALSDKSIDLSTLDPEQQSQFFDDVTANVEKYLGRPMTDLEREKLSLELSLGDVSSREIARAIKEGRDVNWQNVPPTTPSAEPITVLSYPDNAGQGVIAHIDGYRGPEWDNEMLRNIAANGNEDARAAAQWVLDERAANGQIAADEMIDNAAATPAQTPAQAATAHFVPDAESLENYKTTLGKNGKTAFKKWIDAQPQLGGRDLREAIDLFSQLYNMGRDGKYEHFDKVPFKYQRPEFRYVFDAGKGDKNIPAAATKALDKAKAKNNLASAAASFKDGVLTVKVKGKVFEGYKIPDVSLEIPLKDWSKFESENQTLIERLIEEKYPELYNSGQPFGRVVDVISKSARDVMNGRVESVPGVTKFGPPSAKPKPIAEPAAPTARSVSVVSDVPPQTDTPGYQTFARKTGFTHMGQDVYDVVSIPDNVEMRPLKSFKDGDDVIDLNPDSPLFGQRVSVEIGVDGEYQLFDSGIDGFRQTKIDTSAKMYAAPEDIPNRNSELFKFREQVTWVSPFGQILDGEVSWGPNPLRVRINVMPESPIGTFLDVNPSELYPRGQVPEVSARSEFVPNDVGIYSNLLVNPTATIDDFQTGDLIQIQPRGKNAVVGYAYIGKSRRTGEKELQIVPDLLSWRPTKVDPQTVKIISRQSIDAGYLHPYAVGDTVRRPNKEPFVIKPGMLNDTGTVIRKLDGSDWGTDTVFQRVKIGEPPTSSKYVPFEYSFDDLASRIEYWTGEKPERFTPRDVLENEQELDFEGMKEGEIKWWENNATEMGLIVSEINRVETNYPIKKRDEIVASYLSQIKTRLDEMEAERVASAGSQSAASPENVRANVSAQIGTDKWKIANWDAHEKVINSVQSVFTEINTNGIDMDPREYRAYIDGAIRQVRDLLDEGKVINLDKVEKALASDIPEGQQDLFYSILDEIQRRAQDRGLLPTDDAVQSKVGKEIVESLQTINYPNAGLTHYMDAWEGANTPITLTIEDANGEVVGERTFKIEYLEEYNALNREISAAIEKHNNEKLTAAIETKLSENAAAEQSAAPQPESSAVGQSNATPVSAGQTSTTALDSGPDTPIPTTKVSEMGFTEIEIPVVNAVVATRDLNPISSGFHTGFSQEFNGMPPRWAIVYDGTVAQQLVDAVDAAGLEIGVRESPKGSGHYLTDVSLPETIAGRNDFDTAKKHFDDFAEYYSGNSQATQTSIPNAHVVDAYTLGRDTENPWRVQVRGGEQGTVITAIGKGATQEDANANALAEFERLWRDMTDKRNAKAQGSTDVNIPNDPVTPSTSWSKFTEEQWFESLVREIDKNGPVSYFHQTIFGNPEGRTQIEKDGWQGRYHRALGENDEQIGKSRYGRLKSIYPGGIIPNGRKDSLTSDALNAYVMGDLLPRIRKETPDLAEQIAKETAASARFVWNKFLNGGYAAYRPEVQKAMFERVRSADAIIKALTDGERGLDLTDLRGYSFDVEQKVRGIANDTRPNAANGPDTAAAGNNAANAANGPDTASGIAGQRAPDAAIDNGAGTGNTGVNGVQQGIGATDGNGNVLGTNAPNGPDATGASVPNGPDATGAGTNAANGRDSLTGVVQQFAIGQPVTYNGKQYVVTKAVPPRSSDGAYKYILENPKNKRDQIFGALESEMSPGEVTDVTNAANGPDATGTTAANGESAAGLGQSAAPTGAIDGNAGVVDGAVPPSNETVGGGVSTQPSEQGPTIRENAGDARGTTPGDSAGNGAGGSTDAGGSAHPTGGTTGTHGGNSAGTITNSPGTTTNTSPTRGADYVITDGDVFAVGGKKTRYKQNVDAIRLLKKLDAEGRLATPEEQAILVKYVGWGGVPEAFDNLKKDWADEYRELLDLLTPEEYRAARGSVLNAHYTERKIIARMWEAVRRLGYDGGNVLEPSMGIGHFFGLMPVDLVNRPNTKRVGVELDSLSARISQHLYQNAKILESGFEKTDLPDAYFRLGISNIPFGNYSIFDPRFEGKSHLTRSIHNYFFAKTLDKVEPGGIIAFITSRHTLDNVSPEAIKFRQYMADNAEIVAAYRLPENAFAGNAGATVTTDLIFLRKKGGKDVPELPSRNWVNVSEYNGKGFDVNQYFVENPDNMLGNMDWRAGRHGNEREPALLPIEGSEISELLGDAISQLPENIMASGARTDNLTAEQLLDRMRNQRRRENSFFIDADGTLKFQQGGEAIDARVGQKDIERVKGMVELRDIYRNTLETYANPNATPEMIQAAQKTLNKRYDDFVKKFGQLHSDANQKAFKRDVERGLAFGLETKNPHTGEWEKAGLFTNRTVGGKKMAKAETPLDALSVSMIERGYVDLDHMAQMIGTTPDEIKIDLKGQIFQDPNGNQWTTAEEYLSGNVRQKLREAEHAAEIDPAFQYNVERLREVMPVDLAPGEIDARIGASYIPPSDIEEFLNHLIDGHSATVTKSPTGNWDIQKGYGSSTNIQNTFGAGANEKGVTIDYTVYNALDDILNKKKPKLFREGATPDEKIFSKEDTAAALEAMRAVREEFQKWIWSDVDRANRIAQKYNETFNSVKLRKYEGKHYLEHGVPGLADGITLKPHQISAISRALSSGNTLLAHPVGSGKSFEMAAIASEARRLGLAKKILIAAQNGQVPNLAKQFMTAFPNMKLLVVTKKDFDAGGRAAFLAQLAANDYDAVMMQHSQFERIPLREQAYIDHVQKTLQQLQDFVDEERLNGNGKSKTVKQMEKEIKKVQAQLDARIAKIKERKDDVIYFEDLGIDMLMVDEAHKFKNLYFPTRLQDVKGVGHSNAGIALDMAIKVDMINKASNNRGVIFATATPIANSIAETYVQMKYLAPHLLDSHGINMFDDWASDFGEIVSNPEFGIDGQSMKSVERFSKFLNVPELSRLFNTFTDIITTDELVSKGYIKLPDLAGGKARNVSVQPSEEMLSIMGDITRILTDARANPGAYRNSAVDLVQATRGRKASLDLRLVDMRYPDLPDSKLNQMVREAKRLYDEQASRKATQLIFSDLGAPQTGSIPDRDWFSAALRYMRRPFEEVTPWMTEDRIKMATERGHYSVDALGDRLPDGTPMIWNDKTGKPVIPLTEKVKRGGRTVEVPSKIYESWKETLDAWRSDGEDIPAMLDGIAGAMWYLKSKPRLDLYTEIKRKLVAAGIPENEVAIIGDWEGDVKRADLYEKMNNGDIRFLIGSREKMGVGLNVQERMYATHHLDVPWRPDWLEQSNGRMRRQGNLFIDWGIPVHEVRWVQEKGFDTYMWQTVTTKMNSIYRFMKGEITERRLEDISSSELSAAETLALATGNPMALEKFQVEQEFAQLQSAYSRYQNGLYDLRARAKNVPQDVERWTKESQYLNDLIKRTTPQDDKFTITLTGDVFDTRKDAGERIMALAKETGRRVKPGESLKTRVGNFMGLDIALVQKRFFTVGMEESASIETLMVLLDTQDPQSQKFMRDSNLHLIYGIVGSPSEMSDSAEGNMRKLANILKDLPKKAEDLNAKISRGTSEIEFIGKKLNEPFPDADRMRYLERRKQEIEDALGLTEERKAGGDGTFQGDDSEDGGGTGIGAQPLMSAAAALGGFEEDDEGNLVFNPEKAALLVGATMLGSKALSHIKSGDLPLSGYVGNKRTMLKAGAYDGIVKDGNTFSRIVDAFGGSGLLSSAFQKLTEAPRVVNDLSGDVVNFHRVAQERPSDLIMAVRAMRDDILPIIEANPDGGQAATAQAKKMWDARMAQFQKGDQVQQAARTFLMHNGSVSGMDGRPRFYTKEGDWRISAETFKRLEERIRNHTASLQDAVVSQTDARQLLKDAAPGELVLLAPPYINSTQQFYSDGADLSTLEGALQFVNQDMADAQQRGVPMIYSNNYDPKLEKALKKLGFETKQVEVRGNQSTRVELVAWNKAANGAPYLLAPIAGFEQDEDGNWVMNPEKAAFAAGAIFGVGGIRKLSANSRFRRALSRWTHMPAEAGPQVADAAMSEAEMLSKVLPILQKHITANDIKPGRALSSSDPLAHTALQDYLSQQVYPTLANSRSIATQMGHDAIRRTVLDYNRRHNYDELLSYIFPFLYWRTENAKNWLKLAVQRPGLTQNYIKAQEIMSESSQQDENGNKMPKRIAGKMKVAAPFLEDWMGGSMYFDPLEPFFPMKSIYGAEAQKMSWNGGVLGFPPSDDDIANTLRGMAQRNEIDRAAAENAIASKSGNLWDTAKVQAQQGTSVTDNLSELFTPHAPLQWLAAGYRDGGASIGPLLPISRNIRQMTGLFGVNNGQGINIESPVRSLLRNVLPNLPEFDPFEEYRVRRMLANMVENNEMSAKDAKRAMLEKSGKWWAEAARRSNAEKVPFLNPAIPIQVYPTGEQGIINSQAQLRALKQNIIRSYGKEPSNMTGQEIEDTLDARGAYGKGSQLSQFFDAHPELDARSAVFQSSEELLKKWMIDEIWTKYKSASALDKRAIRSQLGTDFQILFYAPATRDYDKIDLLDMIRWGQQIDAVIPNVPKGEIETLDLARMDHQKVIQSAPPDMAKRYSDFIARMDETFPKDKMDALQNDFDELETSDERKDFYKRNPDFQAFRTAWTKFYEQNDDIKNYLVGVGAMENTASLPGTDQSQAAKFYNAAIQAGIDWEDAKAKQDIYETLPKGTGARTKYLQDPANANYKRYYDLRTVFFPQEQSANNTQTGSGSSKQSSYVPKEYDPQDYIYPRRPEKAYPAREDITYWGSGDMYKAMAAARKRFYERRQQQSGQGEFKPDSQTRNSPKLG